MLVNIRTGRDNHHEGAVKGQIYKAIEPTIQNTDEDPNLPTIGRQDNIYDAWDRYQEMLQKFQQYDVNAQKIIQTFYNGIYVLTNQMVNSKGPIPKRTYLVVLA